MKLTIRDLTYLKKLLEVTSLFQDLQRSENGLLTFTDNAYNMKLADKIDHHIREFAE